MTDAIALYCLLAGCALFLWLLARMAEGEPIVPMDRALAILGTAFLIIAAILQ